MPGNPFAEILVLSNTQAKKLAGSLLAIGEEVYRLKDYDPSYPGQPPWRSGAEGKAYPLLGPDDSVVAYLKFFTRPTPKRLKRTAWLIAQQMYTWSPGLAAAPLFWVDTRLSFRPAELGFDFAGYVARAVPGETWLEVKNRMVETGVSLPADLRWRCVEDLVRATAVLERAEMIHGDLSPNNIVIDPDAPADEPALWLIDFDAFVAAAAGPHEAVAVAEGGTYGTDGYCPPELARRAAAGDGSVTPHSDRYGRDMLILELLLMEPGLSPDDSLDKWRGDRLRQLHAAWRAACDPARRQALAHLEVPQVFSLAEADRPTSMQLAAGLKLELPESPVTCGGVPISPYPSAVPGIRWISASVRERSRRREASARRREQQPQPSPGPARSPSAWLLPAQVVPRSLRRVPPDVPKDSVGTILAAIAFFVVIGLMGTAMIFLLAYL